MGIFRFEDTAPEVQVERLLSRIAEVGRWIDALAASPDRLLAAAPSWLGNLTRDWRMELGLENWTTLLPVSLGG
ncbi:MAG: hypothetical protein U0235_00435 [Polyangiaceae bacterium]